MNRREIALRRLAQQRLSWNLEAPAEVVAWLGAVQAQDYAGANWALAQRMHDPDEAAIEQAFNAGAILRTHILRPTWHFVAPTDIRWIQALTAPRVNAVNAYMYRQQELDEALFGRSNEIIARALEGGRFLTRAELIAALAEAGIEAARARAAYLIHRAELDALVCSGPRRGKQFTYALVEDRAPQARVLPRDEALAELTRRYYTGHGPATIQDFAWWSGLTIADVKAGLAMLGNRLDHELVAGQTYWYAPDLPAVCPAEPPAFLLPTYDEFIIGFSSFNQSRTGGKVLSAEITFDSTIVLDGQIAGRWRRSLLKKALIIELVPFAPLTANETAAVTAAADRLARFLKMPAELRYAA